jgi:hypothetical protein
VVEVERQPPQLRARRRAAPTPPLLLAEPVVEREQVARAAPPPGRAARRARERPSISASWRLAAVAGSASWRRSSASSRGELVEVAWASSSRSITSISSSSSE